MVSCVYSRYCSSDWRTSAPRCLGSIIESRCRLVILLELFAEHGEVTLYVLVLADDAEEMILDADISPRARQLYLCGAASHRSNGRSTPMSWKSRPSLHASPDLMLSSNRQTQFSRTSCRAYLIKHSWRSIGNHEANYSLLCIITSMDFFASEHSGTHTIALQFSWDCLDTSASIAGTWCSHACHVQCTEYTENLSRQYSQSVKKKSCKFRCFKNA